MTPPPDGSGETSGFDYIVVGSGAGGGPLAARLAERGYRVLVIEAGPDQSAAPTQAREVSLVPGLHGVSTEHEDLSWRFFVEHYDAPPAPDPKRHDGKGDPLLDGIFYPRASGLGGCTIHNALITIAGPGEDWEDLADFLGDDSWRSGPMREYFRRLEHNDYSPPATSPQGPWWVRAIDQLRWLIGWPTDHSSGRHGFTGWLHTSVTDLSIGLADRQLVRMLKAALWQSRRARLDRAWTLATSFLRGSLFQKLDPNHARTQAEHPEGVVLVPLAACGKRTTIHQNSETPFVMRGRRSSPREFLLETRALFPENLEIWTDTLVINVVFEPGTGANPRPRAIGVRYQKGQRLYRAHPQPHEPEGTPGEVYVKPGGEVILCGGSFNTPQILMLSGIGDREQLARVAAGAHDACVLKGRDGQPLSGQPERVHLPGVGRNLQDRYEVTLISQMRHDFSLLNGATFQAPGGTVPADRHIEEWRADGTGLYTSNGSVLGILKRSRPDLAQPDLFIFGLPLPFRGYEVGYSKVGDQHDKFTWAILKGHTRNSDGTVILRSASPLDPPLVNFHSFNETSRPGKADKDPDLAALVEGVKFVRGITKFGRSWLFGRAVKEEIHPGLELVPDDDEGRMRDWIRRDAWGHHACGTCRMGPAGDPDAVLDSRFRVRHVEGLRVVDASIFPRIPGYFIVANVYMASEKAADVIAEDQRWHGVDTPAYPRDLRIREKRALEQRRQHVKLDPSQPTSMPSPAKDEQTWADDVTGLCLSGGGIRSATFGLGVLQALARQRWLRRVDFLSTVSGGGYIGSFLGRAFDRLRVDPAQSRGCEPLTSPPDRVETELNDPEAPSLQWLRKQGNYIAPSGEGDSNVNTAIFVRNFLSVHFVVGMLLFALLGAANAIRYGVVGPVSTSVYLLALDQAQLPLGALLRGFLGPFFSPWFVLFELVLLLTVLPRMAAYWVVSQDRHGRFSFPGLLLLFVFVSAFLYLAIHDGFKLPMFAIAAALLVSFVHVEMAWYRGREREEAIGRGGIETQRLRTRSYLTQDLGVALALAGGALVFALVDTAGHAVHQSVVGKNPRYMAAIASFIAAAAALAPVARFVAGLFTRQKKAGPPSTLDRILRQQASAIALAAVLMIGPLVFMSFVAHAAYDGGRALMTGIFATLFAWFVSVLLAVLPGALVFVNRSSLSQTYAARLARAYLGASNPLRNRPEGRDVTEVMAEDDVPAIQDYRPHLAGGPLHLLNVTVNQTVDFASQRGNRDRKGENLSVSALGLSVGTRWHAAWSDTRGETAPDVPRKGPIAIDPLGYVPGTDHPLVDQVGEGSRGVEMLSLRQWMAISGAAVGPGRGQTTQVGTALLFGLTNLRTGYWWNSGLTEAARDGLPPLTLPLRLLYALESLFLTQSLLLFEWLARYPGPWNRYWYLSDGGFFENLGAYELIRRRVPRIIVCDASADPTYAFEELAGLIRKARIDFNAEIEPFTAEDYASAPIPGDVRARLGSLDELAPPQDADGNILGPSRKRASLFWVSHRPSPRTGPACRSVLLYIKASITGEESIDVQEYHRRHREFPHEATADQCFEEAQWESYRKLGDHIASGLVAPGAWFWNIQL